MLHNLHWVSSLFSIWTRSVRVSGSGFCQDYIIPPHHDLDFAKTTHHFVMTDTMAQQLVTNTENSPDETDNCVVWNESLKTWIGCMMLCKHQLLFSCYYKELQARVKETCRDRQCLDFLLNRMVQYINHSGPCSLEKCSLPITGFLVFVDPHLYFAHEDQRCVFP